MRKAALAAVLLAAAFSCSQPDRDARNVEREIRSVLDRQVAMWNRGDIEGFMGFYWHSPDFTFQSGDRRLTGWDELLAMYREHYAGENRGTLDFSDIAVNRLSSDAAFVIGRWRVVRPDTTRAGLFTVIFRRFDDGWRIVHDHSS